MRSFHAPPVGAVINRRGPGGRMGRRPAASGFSAPAGGLVQRDAPPISLLVLPKEKRAVHGPKRKNALARSGAVALRARRGSAYRCLLRFCLTFGHAIPFCDSCNCRPVAEGAEGVGVQGRI